MCAICVLYVCMYVCRYVMFFVMYVMLCVYDMNVCLCNYEGYVCIVYVVCLLLETVHVRCVCMCFLYFMCV